MLFLPLLPFVKVSLFLDKPQIHIALLLQEVHFGRHSVRLLAFVVQGLVRQSIDTNSELYIHSGWCTIGAITFR